MILYLAWKVILYISLIKLVFSLSTLRLSWKMQMLRKKYVYSDVYLSSFEIHIDTSLLIHIVLHSGSKGFREKCFLPKCHRDIVWCSSSSSLLCKSVEIQNIAPLSLTGCLLQVKRSYPQLFIFILTFNIKQFNFNKLVGKSNFLSL